MASSDWYTSDEFLRAVQNFHQNYARQPREQIDEAKAKHTEYMKEIENQLRKENICVRIEYTGSTYEGTKVTKSPDNYDLEFDVMVIIDSRKTPLKAEKIEKMPGYARLNLNDGSAKSQNFFGHFENNYLHAEKTANKFYSVMQKCINNSELLKQNIQLRRHGPAIQFDAIRAGQKFFSVDVVPTYEINADRYVAKPIKAAANVDVLAWRRSFSLEEKEKLLKADGDNGCRKKVLRILKALRNREPGLAPLTSYHLKTALFFEMDASENWKEEHLGQRFLGVLGQLDKRLTSGNLQHYFLGGQVNLLSSMTKPAVENIRDRIRRLLTSDFQMKKILTA